MYVGIAVGDKALDTVQSPAVVGLVEGGTQAHGLKVATGIGLGEVHRAGGTVLNTGEVLLLQLLGGKLLDGVGAVLQPPDGGEAYVGTGDNLGSHDGNDARHIETTKATFEGHAIETRLHEGVEVLTGASSVLHATVDQMRTLKVNIGGVGGDDLGGDIA